MIKPFVFLYFIKMNDLDLFLYYLWFSYNIEYFVSSLVFLHHIRDIKDPEHPYSLEELKVITEDAFEGYDKRSYVR
jgi:hypothetical protein